MNWLAHLLLSEPTAGFRIGNLLTDLVSPIQLAHLPDDFQRGIICHRRIDTFTDAHPVFRRSARRFPFPWQRFGGVLTDIFYDHLLASDWQRHCDIPLEDFVAEIYAEIESLHDLIPSEAHVPLQQMRLRNWLCSYREIDGIRDVLARTSRRLRRPLDLASAVGHFELYRAEFEADFATFFPQLRAHIEGA